MNLLARHYSVALHKAHTIATEEEREHKQIGTSDRQEGKHGDDSPSVYAGLKMRGDCDE